MWAPQQFESLLKSGVINSGINHVDDFFRDAVDHLKMLYQDCS